MNEMNKLKQRLKQVSIAVVLMTGVVSISGAFLNHDNTFACALGGSSWSHGCVESKPLITSKSPNQQLMDGLILTGILTAAVLSSILIYNKSKRRGHKKSNHKK